MATLGIVFAILSTAYVIATLTESDPDRISGALFIRLAFVYAAIFCGVNGA